MSAGEPALIGDLSRIEGLIARQRGGDASVHAITLTLVAVAPDQAHRERTVGLLSDVGGSHPLRALVVTPSEGEPRAAVSMACWFGAGREVCSEQVVIEAATRALPSAVASLLAPDLPVFLWWQGSAVEGDPLLGELAAQAGRLVLDGGECGLEGVRAARGLGPAVSDLQWTRLLPWREALAGLFDSERSRSALSAISAVEVVGPIDQARLLAGWLRSRLRARVDLRHLPSDTLERVAVIAGGRFTVERTGRPGVGRTKDAAGGECPVMLAGRTLADQLATELDRLGRDRVFEQALEAA